MVAAVKELDNVLLRNYADVRYQKQIVGLRGHDPLPKALPRNRMWA